MATFNSTLRVGDKVKYASAFLRNIGVFSGDMCFAKGEVKAIKEYGATMKVATVAWDTPDMPDKIACANLVKVGQLEAV